MKYPSYPDYKESGVEWLGEVPGHWEISAIKRIVRLKSGEMITTDRIDPEGAYPVFGGNGLRGYTDTFTHDGFYVLIGRQGALCGNINYANGKFWASEHAIVASPVRTIATRWLGELLFCMNLNQYSLSAAQPGLSVDVISNLAIPISPPPEQRAIAAFLDVQTAKIDTLIAKKRELIDRLKEKRAALITRAVTKGLDPNVKMKDSGVEWLGEVPEHWEVKPIKSFAKIGNGSTPNRDNPEYWEEGDFPWLNSSVVNKPQVTDADQFVTPLALSECHLPIITPPAVLVGITGQGKTRGMATILLINATINQHIAYIKPYETAKTPFLHRVLEIAYDFLRSESDGGGSTKGAITCEQIGTVKIPVPKHSEQQRITEYLNRETAKLDALTTKVEAAIERLQEYRSALITAAVTGKIDVRGYSA